jgi:predicted metallopeptidase
VRQIQHLLSTRLSAEEQLKAYEHELAHIDNQDFDPGKPIEDAEPFLRHA